MTAVEWLKKELEGYGSSSYLELDWTTLDELIEQAKEMEKEQIINAHGNKKRMTPTVGNYLETYTGQQYYNETYNK